jgi:hypothetical protein
MFLDSLLFGFRQRDRPVICAGLLIVESHDHYRAFPFFQILHAAVVIEVRLWRRRDQIRPKLLEQARLPLNVAAQIEHRHAAGSQHEGRELFRFSQAARPKSFERDNQNLLGQVGGGVIVSQVA